jgi:hypothetical protein
MEKYIVIISVVYASIVVAYKIASRMKNNDNCNKVIPMVKIDTKLGVSFPVGIPNSASSQEVVNPVNDVIVRFDITSINKYDIEAFVKIADTIDWDGMVQGILENKDLVQTEYESTESLSGPVLINCYIGVDPPITVELKFDTDFKIKIT